MGRKIRVICSICREQGMPLEKCRILPGGRTDHLRKVHNEKGHYADFFEFDEVRNYHKSNREMIVESPTIDDSEKLGKYAFREVGKYRRIGESIIEVENREEERKHTIYAIVIENGYARVKYIGSTTRGSGRRVSINPGRYKVENLKEDSKTRRIFEELKRGKKAKLYYLTPLPKYDYKGLSFEILRDLETAFIKDFKTARMYDGWNTLDK